MIHVEPILTPTRLSDMRPTQMAVGMREVEQKIEELKDRLSKRRASQWLGMHQVPGVLGPKGFYLTDHHHLCLALMHLGQDQILTRIEADLSYLDTHTFWHVLDARGWCHPYDENGKHRSFDDMPKKLTKLKDDRYRSIAGAVRDLGGFAKVAAPFAEFQWAMYFRSSFNPGNGNWDKWDEIVAMAMQYARHPRARYLPGWCRHVDKVSHL